MILVGIGAICLSISGKGGHVPAIPLVLGVIALGCGTVLAVLIVRGSRSSSLR
jgi:hypothetical protein